MSTRILYLESVAGIAGDMFAAAFVDAGLVSANDLATVPGLLGLKGVRVEISHSVKATMRTTHVSVKWEGSDWREALAHEHGKSHSLVRGMGVTHGHGPDDGHGKGGSHWHTHYPDLDRLLERSELAAGAKELARKVFRILAEAEAKAHGTTLDGVSFHEVGAVDSIVDVAMAAVCIEKVSPARILASPVKLGRGLVQMEHGTHPVPPPAAAEIAKGMPVAPVPEAIARENVELSTPTGLAILKALEPVYVNGWPAGTVRAQGMGAGTMDLGTYPNVFRVVLVEGGALGARVSDSASLPYEADEVTEICFNLDDQTAERTAWMMEELMEQGALDVTVIPVTGKKSRLGVQVSALAEPARWAGLADWILRNTTTFGLRHRKWDRLKLARRIETRETSEGSVRYKIGLTTSGEVLKEKPEFEDLKGLWTRAARRGEDGSR